MLKKNDAKAFLPAFGASGSRRPISGALQDVETDKWVQERLLEGGVTRVVRGNAVVYIRRKSSGETTAVVRA